MRDAELQSLEVALNNLNTSDYSQGKAVCATMGTLFNTFGSYRKIASTLYEGVDKKAKKRLKATILLALLSMAQSSYLSRGFMPDRRKEAAVSFSVKNCSLIEKMFTDATGITLKVENTGNSLYQDVDRRLFEGQEYLLGFLEKWINEHPTIQQAIIGGFVEGVFMEEQVTFLPPLDYQEMVFPFI